MAVAADPGQAFFPNDIGAADLVTAPANRAGIAVMSYYAGQIDTFIISDAIERGPGCQRQVDMTEGGWNSPPMKLWHSRAGAHTVKVVV